MRTLSIRKANKRIMSIPEGAKRNTEAENIFKERTAENFPNLVKELDIQVYEANKTTYYLNVKRPPLRLITLKFSKVKGEGGIVTYKGFPINLPVDF